MNTRRTKKLKVIHSLDEIPDFESEDEEREWWWEHELSDELWDSLPKTTPKLDEMAFRRQMDDQRKRAAG
jgi:hypothetical protein